MEVFETESNDPLFDGVLNSLNTPLLQIKYLSYMKEIETRWGFTNVCGNFLYTHKSFGDWCSLNKCVDNAKSFNGYYREVLRRDINERYLGVRMAIPLKGWFDVAKAIEDGTWTM